MNHTTLALVAVLSAIGFYTFVATQSAAADFDTSNSISQTASNTATATGGNDGDASINQSICQQAGQSGAFGDVSNKLKEC
jgi:uncharacterized membrane protein